MNLTSRSTALGRLKANWFRTISTLFVSLMASFGISMAEVPAQTGAETKDAAALYTAAKKEGKVTFYLSDVVSVGERLAAGFKKSYPGIDVETYRGIAGQVLPRLDQERVAKIDTADVFLTSELGWLEARAKEDALLKPSPSVVSHWPEQFIYHGTIYIASVDPLVIMYNKNMVKVPPTSYTDLLAPEYKDRISTNPIAATSIVAFYDWAEKTLGKDYLIRLKAQNPKFYNGGSPAGQAVAAGEIAAHGIAAIPANATPLIEKGAPIGYVVPNPGIGIAFSISALGWGKHPNAGRLFADYVLSKEGQTAYNGTGESGSPLPGISGSLDASHVIPWDPAAYPPAVVNAFTEHFNSIFKTEH